MNRAEILEAAKKCVCGQRVQDYGKPENNFRRIADLWNAYMGGGCCFTPKDVAVMMALLKVARIKSGTGTEDCFVDLAGYAACAGELDALEPKPKPNEATQGTNPLAKLGAEQIEQLKKEATRHLHPETCFG